VSNDPRDPRIYLRIAGEVRARIEAGEFDSEGKIPPVRTLSRSAAARWYRIAALTVE
jgi:hypothetical protein